MINKAALLFLVFFPFDLFPQGSNELNVSVFRLMQGEDYVFNLDSLLIKRTSNVEEKYVQMLSPIIKEYGIVENNKHHTCRNDTIEYIGRNLKKITGNTIKLSELIPDSSPGTYYFGVSLISHLSDTLKSIFPINQRTANIFQIVIREDDSYLGMLKELFNTPFILAPKTLINGRHQVDLGLGSDCASFAIYGVRRLGYKVPYCGPKGIYKYLKPICNDVHVLNNTFVDKDNNIVDTKNKYTLKPGDIVHFREQVAVFYEDKGIIGVLDKDDLIIQSYIPKPTITTIEKGGFYGRDFGLYSWNWDKLPK